MESVTLVDFADQETLDELLAWPALRGLLTPLTRGKGNRALAIVAEGQRKRVDRILRQLGVCVTEGIAC